MRTEASKSLLGVAGFVIAMIGLALSLVTAWRNDVRSQAAEHQQFIRDTYNSYLEIDHFQMEHPEAAHEFVTVSDYPSEIIRVKQAFQGLSPSEKAQMRLREEAFAFYLFTCFERLVYATKAPESTRSAELDRFLNKQLKYFTEKVLPNPRLIYFWRDDAGFQYFDEDTRNYYSEHVPRTLRSDPIGPFS